MEVVSELTYRDPNYNLCGGRCKKSYNLIDHTIEINTVIDKIFPKSIFLGDAYGVIMQINDRILELSTDTTMQYYVEEIVQLIASVVAAVITGGVGGDMVVSAFFTLRHGITMVSKIIGLVDSVKKKIIVDELGVSETTQFLGDLFNIDLRDGLEGVECWMDAIFKKYNKQKMNVIICEIINEGHLFETLGQFIANFIAASIPDAGYFVKKSIEKMLTSKTARKIIMMNIMKRFKKNYKKMPKNVREMIQNPEIFDKVFLDGYLSIRKEFTSKEFPIVSDETKITDTKKNVQKESAIDNQQGGFLAKLFRKSAIKIGKKASGFAAKGVGFAVRQAGVGDKLIGKIDPIMIYSKLIIFTIHKMLALSYALLCILKKCP